MKIAITSKGTDLDAEIDPRFGRAPYILIVDPETMEVMALDNSSNVNAFKGAGIQAAATISEKEADVLLTGFCGPNAFTTLQAAGIKVIQDVKGKVRDAVEDYRKGKWSFSEAPNVEGHWT
ncbi:MAG: NifB/NifX family molybdenum-iron cluster-binding protein [Deltaproteobacteria bacterium]|nr:NifB/NifX family molybdenum-iron cluster-binding protein [Deltaproteobacteria bacterium]